MDPTRHPPSIDGPVPKPMEDRQVPDRGYPQSLLSGRDPTSRFQPKGVLPRGAPPPSVPVPVGLGKESTGRNILQAGADVRATKAVRPGIDPDLLRDSAMAGPYGAVGGERSPQQPYAASDSAPALGITGNHPNLTQAGNGVSNNQFSTGRGPESSRPVQQQGPPGQPIRRGGKLAIPAPSGRQQVMRASGSSPTRIGQIAIHPSQGQQQPLSGRQLPMAGAAGAGRMAGGGAPPPGVRPPPEPAGHGPPAQQGPAGNAPGGGGMRELRVEDALLYLDEVKREFKNRPRVYNEFLAIMKNFKSQEVDTPGVIARVSRLFRGYNNLILGFNTFLPDGYKISPADLERQEAEFRAQEARAAAQQQQQQQQPQQQQQQQKQQLPPPQQPRMKTQPKPPPHEPYQHPSQRAGTPPAPGGSPLRAQERPPTATGPQPSQQRPPTQMQQWGNRCSSFSETGKQGPTDGAPSGPKFHQDPPESRQAPQPAQQPQQQQQSPSRQIPPQQPQQQQPPAAQPIKQQQSPQGRQQQQQPSQEVHPQQQPQLQQQQQQPPPQQQQQPPPSQQQQQPPPPQQQQAVEFDHAISYVTTIKRRFANDPSTYHSFLEILHTYQKEQRGIKEVLEQVAHLFQDHPDLLKEFTFFLPDAVQEQAKERLHRAAAESESRQAAQRQQALEQYQRDMTGRPGAKAGTAGGASGSSHQKFIDMTRAQVPVGEPADTRVRKRPLEGQPVPVIPQQQQPEMYVYNSAVERQFFDSAREALTSYTRDGGQAWAEFLKCLDMYAQEILSRSEMLNFVEPLLGKRNTKLFEEFKRILAAAGSPTGQSPSVEDAWYSVPLSEIDFSRCRRCSPSYRALPRDYPAPPCSDRNEEEAKVLNDVWVSLPVGSEESYTFRHMRRNTYEEILFRCEDERFEIDMIIDSNAATLTRLEAVANEIAQLSQEEVVGVDIGPKTSGETSSGVGGKRFQYTFDKNILGVIHRNTIARIYGDAGQEMLDLLVKNPTVAVPVVVQRLRQKDSEWRAVRDRLNRHWKELAEHNYYRSLDHRSLTWRTTDKRATSTRTLLAEIKDRGANGGKEGKEALRQKMDKAKEEHGTFYEITMGDALSKSLDLTFLPKPDRRLFTPHLSLLYENNSWAQRDAYRILALALERGPISPADKERCHRLWTEFLGPWFGLSSNWMHKPAVAYQESTATTDSNRKAAPVPSVVSEDDEMDEDSMDEVDAVEQNLGGSVVTEELKRDTPTNGSSTDDSKGSEYMDHHPLPAGAHVSTLYGPGQIVEFRRSDHIYVVKLSNFGATGYLHPSTVLCSVLPVEKSAFTLQLRANDRSKLARPADQLCFGTQTLYLFFRLHQILVHRLNVAKNLAYSVGDDPSLRTLVERMDDSNRQSVGRRRYEAYLSLVYALLDGGVVGASAAEGGKYEDRVRSLLGHGGYSLATMDKLISHIWKYLQAMAGDETMWNLIQLYRRHLDAGSFQLEAMKQETAYLSDGEPIYAFQYCPVSGDHSNELRRRDQSVLHTQYLGVFEESEDGLANGDANGNMDVEASLRRQHAIAAGDSGTEPSSKRQRR